jgi:ABC-type uncharacterized transport system permease subunit
MSRRNGGGHDEGYRPSAIAAAYWAAWVALGLWGFQLLFAYRRNALWMVLAAFLKASWHADSLVGALMLFRAVIVGLGAAAIAGRLRSPDDA